MQYKVSAPRCDTELSTNEQTRKEKTSGVETLHAEIDELTASIAKLSQDITDLSAEHAYRFCKCSIP